MCKILAYTKSISVKPLETYLESLYRDAHCIPNLCPSGGHEEFRTLRSSWKEERTHTRQRLLYWTWRTNPAGHLFWRRGRATNTISCQLRSQSDRPGTCRFFHPKDSAGFIPFWRERELNWVDTHYWKRMRVQRVEYGSSKIRGTQRVNSLVLVWTADRARLSLPPPKTITCSRKRNKQILVL